jgi:hypothetical protein
MMTGGSNPLRRPFKDCFGETGRINVIAFLKRSSGVNNVVRDLLGHVESQGRLAPKRPIVPVLPASRSR